MDAQTNTTTEPQIEIGKLAVAERTGRGKGIARKLRAQGVIPAVVYGGEGAPVALSLDPVVLEKSLDPTRMRNTVFELTVTKTDGSTEVASVMLKDYQIDALSQALTHVDFVRVDVTKTVRVDVPLVLTGKSAGERVGGMLRQVFRTLPVECTPSTIPESVTGDVTPLELAQTLNVADLVAIEGVTICLPPEQTVAQIVTPRGAEEEAEEGEDLEGEDGEGEGEGSSDSDSD